MSTLEELQGLIAMWRLSSREGGYITVEAMRRWTQEIREIKEANSGLRGELAGIDLMNAEAEAFLPEVVKQLREEADDSARVAGELAAENVVLEEELEELRAERFRLQIANAQLQQQLAIAEIGEDPLREA